MADLFRRKNLTALLAESAEQGEGTLRRHLGATNLVLLGIGAIIGAGLFVRTAAAAADSAGAAVTISFIIAAIGCAFAGLCYAEFASMIPIAGSAYTYSYATMGELIAWIIGWDLVLEYALGAATVAVAWSEYLNKLLHQMGFKEIPFAWCHSPFQISQAGEHGIMNLPALIILAMLTLILIKGIQESALVNAIIVIIKVAIVLLFIALGWQYINGANHTPYISQAFDYPPDANGHVKHFVGGWMGILAGAGTVFFAFIGFDAVSTAAQETKNPGRDMPIGILVSLAVCTVLYILFAHVLTGVANFKEFQIAGKEASVAYVIETYMQNYSWLATFVTVAILAGFSSVILVMLLGQSRVFYSMSRDGLLPSFFGDLHPTFRTPYKSNVILFGFVAIFAAFIPGEVVGDMCSIGTLFAFVLVSIGVIIMRKTNPDVPRSFKTPFSPVFPMLGAIVCGAMIFGLGWENWLRLFAWLIVGFVIYFGYGVKHSKLNKG
ncbi:MAG: amino acid permease [Chitinophagales bacterium]|nr:amino acid permease [Chitinophagales bacterium]